MAASLAGLGDELRLRPLNALSQGGVAKQRQSTGVHAQSLAGILSAVARGGGQQLDLSIMHDSPSKVAYTILAG
jgi:hypothetical protein